MPTGNIDEMISAFQNRIDELSSGLIESAEDIMSACKDGRCEDDDKSPIMGFQDDELTNIDNVVGWLQEHETAYNDFNLFFQDTPEDEFNLSAIIDWISDHKTLCDDFCRRFPQLAEEYELTCKDDSVFSSININNEYVDKFCWEIQDAVMGCDIDCDSVECTFSGENFTVTAELPDGSEEDFIVPLADLTGNLETLEDDLDYVVGTIEAELG